MKFLLLAQICVTVYVSIVYGRRPSGKENIAAMVREHKPFPMPQVYVTSPKQFKINHNEFAFEYFKESFVCHTLSLAFNRYYKIIFKPIDYQQRTNKVRWTPESNVKYDRKKTLNKLLVNVNEPCQEYPQLESDESYTLEVDEELAQVQANTVWGALRALETFNQLVHQNENGQFLTNLTYIKDFPRFNHRGLLLDTSRHYIDPEIIKINLEAMEANKMNVFHWHIVDDPSFPYQSYTFPELSHKGAFDPYNHVYTSNHVKEIIEFARQRGIRVVSEFDTPGHTLSWGKAASILTPCYKDSEPTGQFGPIDPSNNYTYPFLRNLVKELTTVFPDKYIHLGGDEVDFSCWQSNPDILKFMNEMEYGNDFRKLEQYYMQKLLDIINEVSPTTGYMIWQEVVDNNVKVKQDTIVEVWKEPWPQELEKVTNYGYRTLLSTCWYLDIISYGDDWIGYYNCEPYNFNGTDEQKQLIIGGEACVWGEYIDGSNVIQRTWPRASAVAERLWSAQNVTDINEATGRLEEQRCRMIKRGIKAQPLSGPGYCEYEVTAL